MEGERGRICRVSWIRLTCGIFADPIPPPVSVCILLYEIFLYGAILLCGIGLPPKQQVVQRPSLRLVD